MQKNSKESSKQMPLQSPKGRLITAIKKPFGKISLRIKKFMSRRPHRSFRRTKRRDYHRSLAIPGYLAFTTEVRKVLWKNKKVFLGLVAIYAVLTGFLVGIASQDTYSALSDTLRDTGEELFSGNLGELGKASLLFIAAATGSFSETLTSDQQIYAGFIGLLTWLTTVWLLRNVLAGHKVKLRDGLYSAGAPILSTFIVILVMIVQLLPLAIALIGINAASSSGILAGGVEAMLFWIAASLLAVLSLFWITSTFIALVVVTLPGMYPFKAVAAAGDLVSGRRIRILLRLIWMMVTIVVVWALIMIPIILIDTWAKGLFSQIEWLPTIPITLLIMTSFTVVWSASYVYLLYRKVVEDDALPA